MKYNVKKKRKQILNKIVYTWKYGNTARYGSPIASKKREDEREGSAGDVHQVTYDNTFASESERKERCEEGMLNESNDIFYFITIILGDKQPNKKKTHFTVSFWFSHSHFVL